MAQDLIADTLNEVMNAKRARKTSVIVDRHSKLLVKVLEIAKELGYVENYKVNGTKLEIQLGKDLHKCTVIKPRFNVTKENIEKYMRRYLPARDMGVIILSTDKGVMTHKEALDKSLGGVLIAYFY